MKNFQYQNLILLCSLLLIRSTIQDKEKGLPIIMFHGLGSSCERESEAVLLKTLKNPEKNPKKNEIHCINYAPGVQSVLTPMKKQSEKACKMVTENIKNWNLESTGFILLGRSQGGLIARSVLMQCEIGKYAKKLITMGTPNNGVSRIPYTTYNNIPYYLNLLIENTVYNKFVQGYLGPAGYFRTLRNYDDYLKFNEFLPEISNEKN